MHFIEGGVFEFGDLISESGFFEFWILNLGFWTLDFCRSWILDLGFLIFGLWNFRRYLDFFFTVVTVVGPAALPKGAGKLAER